MVYPDHPRHIVMTMGCDGVAMVIQTKGADVEYWWGWGRGSCAYQCHNRVFERKIEE